MERGAGVKTAVTIEEPFHILFHTGGGTSPVYTFTRLHANARPLRLQHADALYDRPITHYLGSKVIKLFFGIHAFITKPGLVGSLAKERKNEIAGIMVLPRMNRVIGCSYPCCGLDTSVHDLQGV
jgi:hypothetical protein